MVRDRAFDPADMVVWIAMVLLAMLCGLGIGFVCWSVFAATNEAWPWGASVYALALAMLLACPFLRTAHLRLFVGLCAATLIVSFALGGSLFAPLLSG
ncbi:MAG TPA: hypothetical protein VIN40_11310 [Candidatus Tyrphobacter sp.]